MKLILLFILFWVSIAALGVYAANASLPSSSVSGDAAAITCPSDFCRKPALSAAESAGCAGSTSRSVQDFEKLDIRMTAAQVCATVGVPDWDAGSGLAISVYDLADGSRVLIGFAGPQDMVYAQQVFKEGTARVLLNK